MGCIEAIVAKISERTTEAIFHQLGYLVYYHDNLKGLKQQAEILAGARSSMQHRIDEARNNAQTIEDSVKKWLIDVDEIMDKANRFLIEGEEANKNCWNGSCFNFVRRHKLSRKAKKMANEVNEILGRRGNFDQVSYRGPLSIENSGYLNFETRKLIRMQIEAALKNPQVKMIGVYGMGGLGKTMLVKEIARDFEKEKQFDPIVMVTIGQISDARNIQGQLADKLNLKFEQETEQGRANLLRERLKMEKNMLIVLDDIWSELNFETVGIPRDDCEGCKILVTSRSENVLCNMMNIEKNFEVNCLSKEEAWEFFKKIVGECIETDHELHKIASEVVDKCGKLPIALVTVAKALKGKILPIWRDALRQLKKPETVNIEGVSDPVYASLKLSYDHLSAKEAKSVFLVACFPMIMTLV